MGIKFIAAKKGHGSESDGQPALALGPSVVWSGHLMDYSGYAKANRELLFRVANTLTVCIFVDDLEPEPVIVDLHTQRRLKGHREVEVPKSAPFLRFYTPKKEKWSGPRICFTMMETETVHPDFIGLMNRGYSEVFTPTEWNKRTFVESGLKVPCRVVPLGVNRHIYKPTPGMGKPLSTLISTSEAGRAEAPSGYTFITLCQPTFRKGIDVVIAAFERAFAGSDNASLVLATSVHQKLDAYGTQPFRLSGPPENMKSRVYHLTGKWSEFDMARLYSSFDCYVTASLGEGWNLPMTEAAACGLDVIASKCSSHTELLSGTDAILVEPDGFKPEKRGDKVCIWYQGQDFAYYGPDAVDRFAGAMRRMAEGRKERGERVEDRVLQYGWDRGADIMIQRLLELQ